VTDPATCRHARTQLIAKDSDAEYVECLNCGVILESGEPPESSKKPKPDGESESSRGIDESLADA